MKFYTLKNYTLAAALGLAACAGPSAEQKGAPPAAQASALHNLYPLAVGNQWTYEFVSGDQHKRDTIKILEQRGAWFLDDHRGKLRFDEDGLRDEGRYLLRGPLERGKSWSAVENLVVQRFQLTSVDGSEVTPAGTFLHCVTVRNEELLPDGKGRFVTEWTYAPAVGMVRVKTAVEKPNGDSVPQLSASLVEYRLSK